MNKDNRYIIGCIIVTILFIIGAFFINLWMYSIKLSMAKDAGVAITVGN
jgi:hypothetical protein